MFLLSKKRSCKVLWKELDKGCSALTVTVERASNVLTMLPVFHAHTITTPSIPPEANSEPSGEKLSLVTPPVWLMNAWIFTKDDVKR